MKRVETSLPDCLLLEPHIFTDNRGKFIKTFHHTTFDRLDIESNFKEEYYSISKKGVIRGMHFQAPPMDHYKLVYCSAGSVFDAVVDLRRGSPTYGKHATFELSVKNGRMLYIPSGFAHGFCSLEEDTVMMYRISTEYSQECDDGIRWDSLGITWPTDAPIYSERDKKFCKLENFDSPFLYSGTTREI